MLLDKTCVITHSLQVYFFCGIRTKTTFILLLLLHKPNNKISTKPLCRQQIVRWYTRTGARAHTCLVSSFRIRREQCS
jgi:hypothetical protein